MCSIQKMRVRREKTSGLVTEDGDFHIAVDV